MACTPSPGPGDRRYGPGRRISPPRGTGATIVALRPIRRGMHYHAWLRSGQMFGMKATRFADRTVAHRWAARQRPHKADRLVLACETVPRTEAVRPAAGLGPNCARCGCRGRSSRGRGPPSAGSSAGSGSTSARAGGRIESIRGRIDVAVITIRGENPRKHWPDHVNARFRYRTLGELEPGERACTYNRSLTRRADSLS